MILVYIFASTILVVRPLSLEVTSLVTDKEIPDSIPGSVMGFIVTGELFLGVSLSFINDLSCIVLRKSLQSADTQVRGGSAIASFNFLVAYRICSTSGI